MDWGVVIPVYQGSRTIGSVVAALADFARSQHLRCRVVLVEDGGGAQSRASVAALWERYPGVTAVLLSQNVGQQRATFEGLRHVRTCDRIVTMDDDGAHPVPMLGAMGNALDAGAELCYAVPVQGTGPLYRRIGSRLRDMVFTRCLGLPSGIRASAYRMMTGSLARRIAPEPDGFLYFSAAAARLRPRTVSLPYPAVAGAPSRYTPGKLGRLFLSLLMHYTPLARLRVHTTPVAPVSFEVLPGRGYLWQE